MSPTLEHEQRFVAQGYHLIAGIDEVGRGCWAGPVVAAAVILSDVVYHMPTVLAGLNDSKQLSAAQRLALVDTIQRVALGVGVGMVSAHDIDTLGILTATRYAMQQAVMQLPVIPQAIVVDAVAFPRWPIPQQAIIKGDEQSVSIAAASVIAKVRRDQMLIALDRTYPAYGFAQHKGYGTAQHQQALRHYGLIDQHRRSFRPMVDMG
ncbi:MAG: ribonuclease HII [Chloroflexota bacterium]|jgi:ribonuclease HII